MYTAGLQATSGVRVFLLKSTNTQLLHRFKASTIFFKSLQNVGFVYYSFRLVSTSRTKNAVRLIYRVISSLIISSGTLRIVYARNSQMASSLSQIRLMQYLDNFKLSTRDREEYTGHENLYVFYSSGEPEIDEIPNGSRLQLRTISPLLWSFSRFWQSFFEIEVLNEEEYSILRILYCYSLQHILLAFCNDFDTLSHVRIHSSQKQNI